MTAKIEMDRGGLGLGVLESSYLVHPGTWVLNVYRMVLVCWLRDGASGVFLWVSLAFLADFGTSSNGHKPRSITLTRALSLCRLHVSYSQHHQWPSPTHRQ